MGDIFRIYLKMHAGAPCKPMVKAGDEVKRGQLIAEPEGLGAKIHSSVDGKVVVVNEKYIEIEASKVQTDDYVKIKECDSIWEYAYEAGIVGAGGAGFPTYVKLQSKLNGGYVIANCVECEPILHHNISLIEKHPEKIVRGIKYAMQSTGASKGYIAIKGKNERAIQRLKEVIKDSDNIEIKMLPDMYPMGEERAIIHEIFGRWLEPTQLPLDANCVVLNTETLYNLTEAVEDRKPVIDKDVTVAGKLVNGLGPHVMLRVPIGTSINSLIEKCGGIDGEYGEIIIGGPYTGKAEELKDAFVTKTSGGAIVTIPLPEFKGKIGLLVCACGADEARLRDIASKMKSEVVGVTKCKNVVEVRGTNKCLTPGDCPGQAQAVMYLKKQGAERILVANCNDCTNTVMGCAPKLNIPVYHHVDHALRTMDMPIPRRLPIDKK
ncbi:proline reductase-associated electron transfer protein PrdC [Thermobrachium celere]|uniref:Electron transferring subunit of proline reductase n=1 Tax=Thermobrachium celere DSM 8682 TaxID=941824 RepID=R7RRX0_9CLOT|nr:proline reductase-associated electron transfer protein PrdC [Thermobrachium celere]CDF58819.1 electron transferring subunit of proline reductase [Thermobrachium celere DSM 8682]